LYGVYWEERRLYSTVCPICGGRLILGEKTRRARITKCTNRGFKEDRDIIPLHWAIKHLSALRGEASSSE
jgi:transposase